MPMPTTSPGFTAERSNCSSVSSTITGSPNRGGVAAASTNSHRGVMTAVPNDRWLGLTRNTRTQLLLDKGGPERLERRRDLLAEPREEPGRGHGPLARTEANRFARLRGSRPRLLGFVAD